MVVVFGNQRPIWSCPQRTEGADSSSFYSLHEPSDHVRLDGHRVRRRIGQPRGPTSPDQSALESAGREKAVATIIHEATHQLAYNCGLHTRSPTFRWVSEGLAVYFETPDHPAPKGWHGNVNPERLARFRQYLPQRGPAAQPWWLTPGFARPHRAGCLCRGLGAQLLPDWRHPQKLPEVRPSPSREAAFGLGPARRAAGRVPRASAT